MKKAISLIFILFVTCNLFAQANMRGIDIIPLEISDVKWVFLKFPSNIKYSDMGTDDIIIEKTTVESILRIKSTVPVFDETSITVISTNGKIYTFRLSYNKNPEFIAINMNNVKNVITKEDVIVPTFIELSTTRTSHIILPKKIVDISVGVDTIIAEITEDIPNIAKARALDQFDGLVQTSLTIVTEDKNIYPILVTENDNPQYLNVTLNMTDQNGAKAIFSDASMNEKDMEQYGKIVVDKGIRINNIGAYENKMTFALASLFIKDDVLMFHLYAENNTKIDYEIDFVRCYIQNKKTGKVSSQQDDVRVPIYVYKSDEKDMIMQKSGYSIVLFFSRFTVPDKQILYFEIFEKNGGRRIKFWCSNKEILKAEYLKDTITK